MNGGDRRRTVLLSAGLVAAAVAGALCGCEDDDGGRTVTTQVLADGSTRTVETRVFTHGDGTTSTQVTSIVSAEGGPASTQTWVSSGSSLSPGHVTQSNGEYIVVLTDPSEYADLGTILWLGGGDSSLAYPGGSFGITNFTFDPPSFPVPSTNSIEEPGPDLHLWIGAP